MATRGIQNLVNNKTSEKRISNEQHYELALKEAKKKKPNYDAAYKLLDKAVKLGDYRAYYALGTWYLHGYYFKKDLKKGMALIKQAANKNIPNALYDLAVSYEKGIGVKKSLKLAFENYMKAALCGEKQSLYEVGRCYYYGIGTTKNRSLGNVWLDKAKSMGITS